ncbi:hypothetical protein AQUCO_00200243v1, partial [Aquilegia coerulea]
EKLGVFEVKMGMENNQIILMEKLEVIGILKQAIKIPYKCPKFIFLAFLTSLPLIFLMVLHEIILQTSMIQTKSFITTPYTSYEDGFYYYDAFAIYKQLDNAKALFQNLSPSIFQLCFLYLVPLHLLNLLNTIIIVNVASAIYGERPMRLKEMLLVLINKTSQKIVGIIYGVVSIILTVKWIEWSAVWNMSIVFSVLGERHGLDALGASEYFSEGNRKHGFQLMLLFFVWRIVLRLSCLFVGGHERWVGLVATAFLSCLGNVMKWVVCTVYFYDCKRRILEKKVDVEQGGEVKNANTGST